MDGGASCIVSGVLDLGAACGPPMCCPHTFVAEIVTVYDKKYFPDTKNHDLLMSPVFGM
jgi:hypothetical protein